MTEELHALGVRLMVSIWPIMQPGGDDWRELSEGGYLLGNQATYNAFDPAARAVYWEQANRGLFSHGVDAWWSDCTEPFDADWTGAVKLEPEERMRINTEEAKRYLDPEADQRLLAGSLGRDLRRDSGRPTADKRVINLTRSAYLGQQRFGTVTWSGDVSATWETLRRQIAEGLNFCATGMPYWTTDAGGYFVARRPDLWFWAGDFDAGVADLGYRELYVRWFQYEAWLPIFRSHGTDTPREIWRFGEPTDATYEALAAALRLRYRLLPYLYSLAGWTTQRDYTMLRALAVRLPEGPRRAGHCRPVHARPGLPGLPRPPSRVVRTGVHADRVRAARPARLPARRRRVVRLLDRPCLPVARRSRSTHRSSASPSSSGPDRSSRWALSGSIPARPRTLPWSSTSIRDGTRPSRSTRMRATATRYEQGAFATVEIRWDDRRRRLSIGERSGTYEGMPATRTMVVKLHPVAGRRIGAAAKGTEDLGPRVLCYAGQAVDVQL